MENNVVDIDKLRQGVFDYARIRLGDGMVDVDLDPVHYQNALTRAIEVFRTRSSAGVEESFAFLQTKKDKAQLQHRFITGCQEKIH